MIGLQWGDIDFRGGLIEIRRAFAHGVETSTKSHKVRRVDLTPQLAETLRKLQETRSLEAAMNGTPMPKLGIRDPVGESMGCP